MLFPLSILIIFTMTILIQSKVDYTDKCTSTQALPINPYPNLKKCYRYNNAACCNINDDEAIKEYTSSYIIDDCLRKYPDFEDLLCFRCNPLESTYYRSNVLYICEDYAMKIWNAKTAADLLKPSTVFDNCGFKIPEGNTELGKYAEQGQNYFLPSKMADFDTFINEVGIPIYSGATIKVQPASDTSPCFKVNGIYMTLSYLTMMICIGMLLS